MSGTKGDTTNHFLQALLAVAMDKNVDRDAVLRQFKAEDAAKAQLLKLKARDEVAVARELVAKASRNVKNRSSGVGKLSSRDILKGKDWPPAIVVIVCNCAMMMLQVRSTYHPHSPQPSHHPLPCLSIRTPARPTRPPVIPPSITVMRCVTSFLLFSVVSLCV